MVGIRRFLTYFDSRVIDHEEILGDKWFASFPSWALIEGAPFGPDNMSLPKASSLACARLLPYSFPTRDSCVKACYDKDLPVQRFTEQNHEIVVALTDIAPIMPRFVIQQPALM